MNAYEKEYSKLIGKRVKGLVKSPPEMGMKECYGLEFTDGTVAWIMCDPEGNGPGFLAIEKPEAA